MHRRMTAAATLATAFLAIAVSVRADSSVGQGFWAPKAPETQIRAEPSDSAKEMGRLPLGGRVRWREKRNDWLHVQVAGIDGWAHASDVSDRVPTAAPGKPILLDPNARGFSAGTAYTSAARGFDKRAIAYALANKLADEPGSSRRLPLPDAMDNLAVVFQVIGVHFRDPAADGRTPDSAGVAARRGFFEDTHIPKGRIAVADAFRLPDTTSDVHGNASKKLAWWKAVSLDVSHRGPNTKDADFARQALKPMKQFSDATDAYRAALDSITAADARAIGQAAAIDLASRAKGGVYRADEDLVLYVNDVGNLISLTERPTKKVDGLPRSLARRVFVVVLDDDQTANAFSAPGGWIFVTTGMLRRLDSESELAFVLAHEIGHVDLEHGLDALKLSKGVPRALEEVLAQAFNAKDNPVAMFFLNQNVFDEVTRTAANKVVEHAGFWGRKEELAADEYGLEHLARAGYDGAAALRVLDTLEAEPGPAASEDDSHDSAKTRREILAPKIAVGGVTGYERYQRFVATRLAR